MIATMIIFIVGLLTLLGVIYYRVHMLRESSETDEVIQKRTHRWLYNHAKNAKTATSYYGKKSIQAIVLAILQLGVMITFFTRKYTIKLIEHIKERVAPIPKNDGSPLNEPVSGFLKTMNNYKKKLREFHQELENNHEERDEEVQLTENKNRLQ